MRKFKSATAALLLLNYTSAVCAEDKLPSNWTVEVRTDPMTDVVTPVAITPAINDVSSAFVVACNSHQPFIGVITIYTLPDVVKVKLRIGKKEPEFAVVTGKGNSLVWDTKASSRFILRADRENRVVFKYEPLGIGPQQPVFDISGLGAAVQHVMSRCG